MTKLISRLIICILLLFPARLVAQNSYANKIVSFPAGHSTLKVALNTLSRQTGCVFSYDPTKINDKQEFTFPQLNKQPLKTALQKLLPKPIKFKFTGKYVVLLKPDAAKIDPPVKTPALSVHTVPVNTKTEFKIAESFTIIAATDTIQPIKETSTAYTVNPPADPIPLETSPTVETPVAQTIQKITTATPDTVKSKTTSSIIDLGFAANKHLSGFFAHIGVNQLYAIISTGSDYHKSYHLGLGAGVKFQFTKHWGINIDLIQYALVRGKSYKVNVRAATTELTPMLDFAVVPRLKLFAGPSFYLIKSRYLNGNPTGSLGKYVGYSALLGLKIDLGKSKVRKI
ncbi:hypothetical protein Palpr_2160 [Paludibacter propionicigenes WB4]|uniref:Outer membrane protein beta-barrel domain-containing protein n=1 Tax=Paludibacter propionicigenes (strain DSM 17365 / JCM 13257 / WB4) TaxID=694427 RepID=E4T6F2_PALPW|nr:hypothetical protein [Paludibacter propionicigenes]ADQ80296.1 hypothetical protein Palpr_2160 [Paludibacter propionicigenes WB4]